MRHRAFNLMACCEVSGKDQDNGSCGLFLFFIVVV